MHEDLFSRLDGRYTARICERRYTTEPTPDTPGNAVEQREEYIEIYGDNDARLVTSVHLVSPANKTNDAGRRAYLHTRRQAEGWGANLVDIDLVLSGTPITDYPREDLPDWDYAVTVTRSSQPGRYEIYSTTLDKVLPRIRLPLTAPDRDFVSDIQRLVERAYDQGEFAAHIEYGIQIVARMQETSRRRLRKTLSQVIRLTQAHFTHDEIAVAAYYIWLKQGCPEGLGEVHWQLAMEQLLTNATLPSAK
jgi:hypothetical protein